MLVRALDLLVPPGCAVCRTPHAGGPLCGACRAALPWLVDPCPRCALPRAGGLCLRCPATRTAFTHAWSPLAHAGPARDLVLALKHRGVLAAADAMAAILVAHAPPRVFAGAGALVPVPAVARRRRRRGFDHAGLLTRAIAARTGLPVAPLLHALGDDGPQVGRGRRARRRTQRRFALAGPPRACGWAGHLILIDDVHTTGATLDGCAATLRLAGFQQIRAATFVRTLTRS